VRLSVVQASSHVAMSAKFIPGTTGVVPFHRALVACLVFLPYLLGASPAPVHEHRSHAVRREGSAPPTGTTAAEQLALRSEVRQRGRRPKQTAQVSIAADGRAIEELDDLSTAYSASEDLDSLEREADEAVGADAIETATASSGETLSFRKLRSASKKGGTGPLSELQTNSSVSQDDEGTWATRRRRRRRRRALVMTTAAPGTRRRRSKWRRRRNASVRRRNAWRRRRNNWRRRRGTLKPTRRRRAQVWKCSCPKKTKKKKATTRRRRRNSWRRRRTSWRRRRDTWRRRRTKKPTRRRRKIWRRRRNTKTRRRRNWRRRRTKTRRRRNTRRRRTKTRRRRNSRRRRRRRRWR